MLIALTLLLAGLCLLLAWILFNNARAKENTLRAHARERANWQIQQNDLMDRLMVMKGHREYAPLQPTLPEPEPQEESPWEEL